MSTTSPDAAPITDYLALHASTAKAMRSETGLDLWDYPEVGSGEHQIVARIVSQGLLARLQEQDIEGVDRLAEDLEAAIEDNPRANLLDLAEGYEPSVNQDSRTQNKRQRMVELARAIGGTAEAVTASILGSQQVEVIASMAGQMITNYDDPTIRGRKATREALRHYVKGAVVGAKRPERTAT